MDVMLAVRELAMMTFDWASFNLGMAFSFFMYLVGKIYVMMRDD